MAILHNQSKIKNQKHIASVPKTKTTTSHKYNATASKNTAVTDYRDDVAFYVFVGFVATVFLVSVRPFVDSSPEFQINSVSVSSLSPFNISGNQIGPTPGCNLSFTIKSPRGDIDVVYDNTVVTLMLKKEIILMGMLAPFQQEASEDELVTVRLSSIPGFLDNWAVDVLSNKGTQDPCISAVTLDVRMESRIRYGP